jgi:hypothetical protein
VVVFFPNVSYLLYTALKQFFILNFFNLVSFFNGLYNNIATSVRNLFLLVSEFRCNKEKSSFEDVHGGSDGDCVEVLELDLSNHVFVVLQLNLEDVTLEENLN